MRHQGSPSSDETDYRLEPSEWQDKSYQAGKKNPAPITAPLPSDEFAQDNDSEITPVRGEIDPDSDKLNKARIVCQLMLIWGLDFAILAAASVEMGCP